MILLSVNSFAEDPVGEMKRGTLKGFVFNSGANQPLEYATISVIRKKDNTIATGTITDETGFFKIKDMDFGMYQVKISFIGYKSKTIDKVMIRPDNNVADL
nr:carboxypeptidase-like regulatory domain-containing protein [Bacteroidales bacterium]